MLLVQYVLVAFFTFSHKLPYNIQNVREVYVMYNNQTYDDYIRSILGYPMQNNNMCRDNTCFQSYDNMPSYRNQDDEDLENMYPEIYKIIFPMIQKACDSNTRAITRETVDSMVDDIYSSIETDNIINVNINLQNENRSVSSRS